MDNMKYNGLSDEELEKVGGGATVVEIKKDEVVTRCFNCGSDDVDVEKKGAYISVSCKKCGAVDLRSA